MEEKIENLSTKFSGIMEELAATASTVEGVIAGKTSGASGLWKFVEDSTKVLDFCDPKKLAESGKLPLTNRKRDGRFDKEGNGEIYGHCEECGKALDKPSKDGFCSRVCALKHCAANISGEITELKEKKENLMSKLNSVVELTNTLTGLISDTATELASLPNKVLDPRWETYFKVRLNILKTYLTKTVNDLLIQKNYWMMHQVEKSKALLGGKVNEALGSLDKVKKATDAAKKICDQMEATYDKAYQTVVNSLAPWKLEPESINFNMTPRSNTYFPGKFAVKLKNNNSNDSICDVIDIDKIYSIVENSFPHITEEEYVMEPEAFNIRKLFSEYNVRSIKEVIEQLMPLLKLGSEPLPKYEDLKLTNPWWMVFLLTSFLPQAKKHYALPFCP